MSTTVHMEGVHVQHGSLERAHAAVRLGFLRKVYGILAAQLALTLLVCTAFSAVPQIKEFVQASSVLFVIAVISSFVTLFALILNRHSYPANIQLLALFTFLEAYTVGTAVTYFSADVVLQALALTASIVLGLTLYTFQTKRDFTIMHASLGSCLWAMLYAGFLISFFPLTSTVHVAYAVCGAVLFSLFIIVDTQLMMNRLSADEYIIAAVDLYLDILNLFLYILRILNDK
eukprot:m.180897 g.180897  ORF g.180897 m.180897 type:complete len:231 (+) comp53449_c0_seq4:35-727(+)